MKANELRVGNWVYVNDGGDTCQVLGVDQLGVSIEVLKTNEITWVEHGEFSPIPITPEILEKCGAKQHKSGNYVVDGYYVLYKTINGFVWYHGMASVYHTELKYLHQLQNLIYSLTGRELEVNL